jgi:probable phosphoglycerate mutase
MIKKSNVTRFGLIRHAQTVWNQEKKIQGHSDSPLTADGVRQASSWGKILEQFAFNRLLTSDTGRALETAKKINTVLKIQLIIDPRLREQDWGHWVGKPLRKFKLRHPGRWTDR